MPVQSVIFDKSKFSRESALSWARSHGFKTYTIRETEGSFRVRQFPPDQCKSSGGTKNLAPGVSAYVCGSVKEMDGLSAEDMPFGQYDSFADCVSKNSDKDDANAYCGFIMHQVEGGIRGAYDARFEPFEKDGHHFLKVFAIDDGVFNQNKWGVTKEATKQALQTLIGKPLVGPPDAGHGPRTDDDALLDWFERDHTIGKFVDVGENDRYAWGIAEVMDAKAWAEINAGKWKYVSPMIQPLEEHISMAGEMVDKYRFRHVAFVDKPAYGPLANVKGTCTAQDFRFCNFAAAVDTLRSDVKKGLPSPQNYMPTEEEFKAKCAQLDTLNKDHAEMKGSYVKLQADFDALKKRETDRLATELKAKAIKVAEARIALGLAKAEEKDTLVASLEKLGNDVLDGMFNDLTAMQAKVAELQRDTATRNPSNPSLSFKAAGKGETGSDLSAADLLKERMFGGS